VDRFFRLAVTAAQELAALCSAIIMICYCSHSVVKSGTRAFGLRLSPRVARASRGVAQPGRAPGSGPGGRRFKSSLPDQLFSKLLTVLAKPSEPTDLVLAQVLERSDPHKYCTRCSSTDIEPCAISEMPRYWRCRRISAATTRCHDASRPAWKSAIDGRESRALRVLRIRI
jgi:hypothetical protein